MKSNRIEKLFSYVIVFDICWGAHAWFTWHLESGEYAGVFALILLFIFTIISEQYRRCRRIVLLPDTRSRLAFLFFLIAIALNSRSNLSIPVIVRNLLWVYPMVVMASDRDVQHIIKRVQRFFYFILIPGIILHIMYLTIGLPGTFITAWPNNTAYIFNNYIFLLRSASDYEQTIRFLSVFCEPAYLGTLLAFLLYVTKYDIRSKENKIILIGLLLSFSLAGYIIALLGYIVCIYQKGGNIMKYIIYGVLLASTYIFLKNYNNGDNIINQTILSRLDKDEDKGIAGNNRNSSMADFYMLQVLFSDDRWLGLGIENVTKINGGGMDAGDYTNQIRGAGYVVFIVYYGILPIIFYFLFYLYIGPLSLIDKRIYMWGFLLLILLTFIQAAYPNSYAWIIPYILAKNNHQQNCKLCE